MSITIENIFKKYIDCWDKIQENSKQYGELISNHEIFAKELMAEFIKEFPNRSAQEILNALNLSIKEAEFKKMSLILSSAWIVEKTIKLLSNDENTKKEYNLEKQTNNLEIDKTIN